MVAQGTHKPVGFLHAVDFSADATSQRKWLGILTQRRLLYFGVFTEDQGRFSNTANCMYWFVAGGCTKDPGGQSFSLDYNRAPSTP